LHTRGPRKSGPLRRVPTGVLDPDSNSESAQNSSNAHRDPQRGLEDRPRGCPEGTAEWPYVLRPRTIGVGRRFSRPFGTCADVRRIPALKRRAILVCPFGTEPLFPIRCRRRTSTPKFTNSSRMPRRLREWPPENPNGT